MRPYWLLVAALTTSSIVLADPGRLDPMGNVLKIDPSMPPSGMNIMQILLENQALPLKGTRCDTSDSRYDDKRALQHKLAITLGHAVDNKRHVAVMLGGCKSDKSELKPGMLVNTWHCNINVVEQTKRGGFIANASIDFWVKKDDWTMIPEKLLCM